MSDPPLPLPPPLRPPLGPQEGLALHVTGKPARNRDGRGSCACAVRQRVDDNSDEGGNGDERYGSERGESVPIPRRDAPTTSSTAASGRLPTPGTRCAGCCCDSDREEEEEDLPPFGLSDGTTASFDDSPPPLPFPSNELSSILSSPSDVLHCVMECLDLDGLSALSEVCRPWNAACQSFLRLRLRLQQTYESSSRCLTTAEGCEPLSSSSPPPVFDPTSLALPAPDLAHVRDLSRLSADAAREIVLDELVRPNKPSCVHGRFDDDLRGAYRHAMEALQLRMREAVVQVRNACSAAPSSGEEEGMEEEPSDSAGYLSKKGGAALMATVAVMAMAAASASTSSSTSCSIDGSGSGISAVMLAASSSCPFPTLEQVEEVAARLLKLGVMGTLMKGAANEAARRTGGGRHLHREETTKSDSSIDAANLPSSPSSKVGASAAAPKLVGGMDADADTDADTSHKPYHQRGTVRGCVGAYRRVLARSRDALRTQVKQARKGRFDSIPSSDERSEVAARFMEACRRDDLPAVRELIHRVDVEGFYASSDGTTTCGLHSAAFHDSCRVAEFLVTGGCCDVNLTDANGWTALHFAAGASALKAAQLLIQHGADDSMEASNGYTPLQWAVRLQNAQVVPLLLQARQDRRQRLGRSHPNHHHHHYHFFLDALPNLVEFMAAHGPPAGAMARFVLSTLLPERA